MESIQYSFNLILQFTIMAMHARPVPADPYNPNPSHSDEEIHHPSPFIPIRMPIFAAVVWLDDWLIRLISLGGGNRRFGHMRSISDVDSIEDGHEVTPIVMQAAPSTTRINIGRRKRD
jgi:etoposide-induced 2.4 mRNA